jgi:hypothetical protein
MAIPSPEGACPLCGGSLVEGPDRPVLDAACPFCGGDAGPAVFVDVDPVSFLARGLAVGMTSDEIVAAYRRELVQIPDEDDAPEA